MSDLDELGINEQRLRRIIELAKEEELALIGDITTQALQMPSGQRCKARLVARADGVAAGLEIIPFILREYGSAVSFEESAGDRRLVRKGDCLGVLSGDLASVLSAERLLLNFIQHLSGIATLTRRFVDTVAGTEAKIYDTRKTLPGLRDLEKYAVRCGGGHNHRHGLHDAVLVKDNHLAGIEPARLAGHAFEILNQIMESGFKPRFVEFEVDSLAQLEELFKVVGIDIILLDNFTMSELRRAVSRRYELGLKNKVQLEASGGITLTSVRTIAETGVERIAIGALTHSATALDISLEV